MITYKNWRTGNVISENEYNKLSYLAKSGYSRIFNDQCNHSNDSTDDLLTGLAAGAIISSFFDDSSNNDSSSSSSSDDSFGGFGGGDFGGGGAGGDW